MSAPMPAMPAAMTNRPILPSSRARSPAPAHRGIRSAALMRRSAPMVPARSAASRPAATTKCRSANCRWSSAAAADFSALNVSGEATSLLSPETTVGFDTDWAATMRGRIGVASPKVLVYATGGYAAAGLDVRAFDLSLVPGIGLMDVSGGGTESGWVVGGGAEWRMTQIMVAVVRISALQLRRRDGDRLGHHPAGRFPALRERRRFRRLPPRGEVAAVAGSPEEPAASPERRRPGWSNFRAARDQRQDRCLWPHACRLPVRAHRS